MKRIITMAAIAVLATSPLACAPASTDVKLGLIVSLEGTGEPYGSSIRDGVTLAVEELNATGGINVDNAAMKPIVLVIKDTHSDPVRGAEMAHEVLAEAVVATIGADVSDVTLAIAPHFQEAQQILLSPASSTPKLTTAGDFIYRNFPSDDLEALNVADHIFNKAGLREAAVISNQNEFGLGQKSAFIQRFRTLGGRDVGQESFPTGATTEQIAQAVQSIVDAPAIYIAGYAEETAAVVSALRAAGSEAALFGTGAVLGDRLVSAGGEAVEGFVFPRPSFDPMSEVAAVENFVTAFRDKYNRIPDTYAGHGYDAVMILAQAIQEAGVDPAEIRFYLNSMNPYDGVTGTTDFDDNGDVRKYHRMYTIREGVAVPVGD